MRRVQMAKPSWRWTLVVAAFVAACGGGGGGDGAASGGRGGLPPFTGVWVIVFENHGDVYMLNHADAKHFRELASTYAVAGNYSDITHPSLPNYIEMACGCNDKHSSFTVRDEPASNLITSNPNRLFREPSLGGQLEAAGVEWRAYGQDSTPGSKLGPCTMNNSGLYVSRHVPFLYFQDVFGTQTDPYGERDEFGHPLDPEALPVCVNRIHPFGDFLGTPNEPYPSGDFYWDLGNRAMDYYWITPDQRYNMHDGSVAEGDLFLEKVVGQIQQSPQYRNGGVIFITFDEGDLDLLDQILFIAVSPYAKRGYVSSTAFDHDNFLATVEDIYGLPRLGRAQGVPNMAELFQP